MKKIILASGSERRIKMFREHGCDPAVIPTDIDEVLPLKISPESSSMYLAYKKASAAYEKILSHSVSDMIGENILIFGADTIVVHEGSIIGKPADENEAYSILSKLNGSVHTVITGVCVIDSEIGTALCFFDKTFVYFRRYSDDEIKEYIKTSEPYDKAGACSIQGTFGKNIDRIEGDYDNVVGLPWYRIAPFLTD